VGDEGANDLGEDEIDVLDAVRFVGDDILERGFLKRALLASVSDRSQRLAGSIRLTIMPPEHLSSLSGSRRPCRLASIVETREPKFRSVDLGHDDEMRCGCVGGVGGKGGRKQFRGFCRDLESSERGRAL
jgi:hypothetical protein